MDLHLARLHESVAWGHPVAEDQLNGLAAQLSTQIPDGDLAAVKQLSLIVRKQAEVMSFSDIFVVLTAMFLAMGMMTLLMRRPPSAVSVAAH